MKNLKRALSFALATVMLVGMMVIGASAAGFEDADKIVNTDAVNTMVALGIIKGKDDGSNFDPEGIVTRAEMAKMICVALNGGKDPNLAGGGLYADTKGHWAAGYIDYCTNMGIVSGDTAGNFNPDKTVTGTEAAKMILIALGYSAENEKFVNDANWALNINIVANAKDLYKDLAILPSEGLTRDNAAQMLWNGMDASIIEYDYKLTTENGELKTVAIAKDKLVGNPAHTVTILSEKFKMNSDVGILSKVTYDKDTAEYTYVVSGSVTNASANLAGKSYYLADLTTEADFTALYGQKVKVLYTVDSNGATDTVYGIYGVSNKVFTTTVGEITAPATPGTDTFFKVNGVKYDLDTNFNGFALNKVVYNAAAAAGTMAGNLATYDPSCTVTFVSIDNDSDFEYAVVTPVKVGEVTYVGKDAVTAANGTYKFADDAIAEGIAKGDYVMIVDKANALDNKNHIEIIETLEGTVTGTRSGEAQIDGTWYDISVATGDALTLGETYELKIVGGYIYNASQVSEGTTISDILYVSASENAGALSASKTKVYFTDGKSEIVNVTKVDGSKIASGSNVSNGLYTFKVKDSGYELTTVSATNDAGMDYLSNTGNFAKKTSTTAAKMANCYIADDAVVFVDTSYGSGSIKVLDGKTVKDWSSNLAVGSGVALTKTVSGLKTAKVMLLTASVAIPSATGEVGNYGVVLTTPYKVKDGDDQYDFYSIWTVDGKVDVYDEDNDAAIKKGDVIEYTKVSETVIKDSTKRGTNYAVTGFDGTNIELFKADGTKEGTTNLINDDTVILYVDSKNAEGVTDGKIDLATTKADGSVVLNAIVYDKAAADGVAEFIVYDVNNELCNANGDALTPATVSVSWHGTKIAGSHTNLTTANMEVSAAKAIVGKKLAVSVNLDKTTSVTLAANKALKISVAGTGVTTTSVVVPTGTYAQNHTIVVNVPVTGTVTGLQVTLHEEQAVPTLTFTNADANSDGTWDTAVNGLTGASVARVGEGPLFSGDTVDYEITLTGTLATTNAKVTLTNATTSATVPTGATKTSDILYTLTAGTYANGKLTATVTVGTNGTFVVASV